MNFLMHDDGLESHKATIGSRQEEFFLLFFTSPADLGARSPVNSLYRQRLSGVRQSDYNSVQSS